MKYRIWAAYGITALEANRLLKKDRKRMSDGIIELVQPWITVILDWNTLSAEKNNYYYCYYCLLLLSMVQLRYKIAFTNQRLKAKEGTASAAA